MDVSIPQAVGTVATSWSMWPILTDLKRFNTASGKRCYFITFVFPSFQSGTRDVRTSSSLRSSAASHPSSHTASDRCCCNFSTKFIMIFQHLIRFNTASGKHCCNKRKNAASLRRRSCCFNTASGRRCCNSKETRFKNTTSLYRFQYRER